MTDPFKDYKPEVVEYDEEVDGGGEHLVRNITVSLKCVNKIHAKMPMMTLILPKMR